MVEEFPTARLYKVPPHRAAPAGALAPLPCAAPLRGPAPPYVRLTSPPVLIGHAASLTPY